MELYKNRIPIGNIYYMLCYAFKDLSEQSVVSVNPEEFENIYQLMAEIIKLGVSYQLKKGLLRQYEGCMEESVLVRGKINVMQTINSKSQIRRKLVCEFDEYTENTLMNRILKSVMLLLIRSDIKREQAAELRKILRYFGTIETADLFNIKWDLLLYNRNNREYRLLMSVCRIICENMLHSTEDGNVKLVSFSDENLNRLYEKFILNYYVRHYPRLKPSAPEIKWAIKGEKPELMPKMQSDIVLCNKDKKLIIDAKFYSYTTQENYDKDSFHSHNMYQIFTYVKNEACNFDGAVDGMLLYAKTKEDVIPNEGICINIDGNNFSVKSLDLSGDFESIKRQLDEIADILCC